MTPYFSDGQVTLYLGDMREVLPALQLSADVVVTDPPYQETSLAWDRWPDGWPAVAAGVTDQMWCFGSMRMFFEHLDEFKTRATPGRLVWKFAQDVVWQKHAGTSFAADRFRRIHEHVTHWYRGPWGELYRDPQRRPRTGPPSRQGHHGAARSQHLGEIGNTPWVDDGTRIVESVIEARTPRSKALRPTEKPAGILLPLIKYSCPEGGLVLDPFAGSGSTLDVARALGMRAVGVEADERSCDVAGRRLSQAGMFAGSDQGWATA